MLICTAPTATWLAMPQLSLGLCVCGRCTETWRWSIYFFLLHNRDPCPQRVQRFCVFVLMSMWLAGQSHLSIFSPAVLSIIPGIWQPKPVKKTFFLASVFFFKGSDTGDNQPQKAHIFQSTCMQRAACKENHPSILFAPSQNTASHSDLHAQDAVSTHPLSLRITHSSIEA